MTTPPTLTNGDINYAHVESFLQFSTPLPPVSETGISQADVNQLANYYNAEVNLILDNLGFAMPITAANSLNWIRWTKTLPVAAFTLHGIAAQDSDETITARADKLLEEYRRRIEQLTASGGTILDAALDTDPVPTRLPVALGIPIEQRVRRKLRFEQLARVEKVVNDEFVRDFSPDEWLRAIRGV